MEAVKDLFQQCWWLREELGACEGELERRTTTCSGGTVWGGSAQSCGPAAEPGVRSRVGGGDVLCEQLGGVEERGGIG